MFVFYTLFLLQWCYSPTWALAFSIFRLQTFLSSADVLQFLHFNVLLASLSSVSIHPLYVSFESFLGYPFVLQTHHMTHPLESSQSDILCHLHFLIRIINFIIIPVSPLFVIQHGSLFSLRLSFQMHEAFFLLSVAVSTPPPSAIKQTSLVFCIIVS